MKLVLRIHTLEHGQNMTANFYKMTYLSYRHNIIHATVRTEGSVPRHRGHAKNQKESYTTG